MENLFLLFEMQRAAGYFLAALALFLFLLFFLVFALLFLACHG